MPPPLSMIGKPVRSKQQSVKPPLFDVFVSGIDFHNQDGRSVHRDVLFKAYSKMVQSRGLSLSPDIMALATSQRRFFIHFRKHVSRMQRNLGLHVKSNSVSYNVSMPKSAPRFSRDELGLLLDGPVQRYFDPVSFFEAVDEGRHYLPFARVKTARLVGFGAIATRFIQAGEIVTEYKGTVQSEEDVEAFDKVNCGLGPPAHYEIKRGSGKPLAWNSYLHEGKVIGIVENPGAWLNSKDNRSEKQNKENYAGNKSYAAFANCRSFSVTIGRRLRLYIRSVCDILEDEELIQDYFNPNIADS